MYLAVFTFYIIYVFFGPLVALPLKLTSHTIKHFKHTGGKNRTGHFILLIFFDKYIPSK